MRVAPQHAQVDRGGLRRVLVRQGDQPVTQLRSAEQVRTAGNRDQGVRHRGPVGLVGCLKARHQHGEPGQQFPGAFLDQVRARIGDAEICECELDEPFDLLQAPADAGGELSRCADEPEKARRVHLLVSKVGEHRQLLGVLLRAGDDERATMLRAIRRRVDDLAHEGADELPGRLVALHQVRCAAYPDREDERRLQVVSAGRADDQDRRPSALVPAGMPR